LQEDSGPIDVDFAFDPGDPADVRGCLRMSGSATQLGVKATDFDDLDVTAETDALATVYDRYHVVHIERQPDDWYVFLEEKLIGSLPSDEIGDGQAIRLVVHGGKSSAEEPPQAYFADVELSELLDATSAEQ
jgi:hypothetical protein